MPIISREERRRKNHEKLLNMLFPPPSLPPQQDNEEEQSPHRLLEEFNADDSPNEESESSSSTDDDVGNGKLTRAQRKRLRKKKLKQTALQRRKIIGPLLPSTSNKGTESDLIEIGASSVRHNAIEGPGTLTEESGCVASNKLQHRRKAKRQAKEKENSCNRNNIDRECPPCDRGGNTD